MTTGRNFNEVMRVIDSIQLTAAQKVATPANWKHGKDCIIVPGVKDDEAKIKYPAGFKTVKPYLRFVKQPALDSNQTEQDRLSADVAFWTAKE